MATSEFHGQSDHWPVGRPVAPVPEGAAAFVSAAPVPESPIPPEYQALDADLQTPTGIKARLQNIDREDVIVASVILGAALTLAGVVAKRRGGWKVGDSQLLVMPDEEVRHHPGIQLISLVQRTGFGAKTDRSWRLPRRARDIQPVKSHDNDKLLFASGGEEGGISYPVKGGEHAKRFIRGVKWLAPHLRELLSSVSDDEVAAKGPEGDK